MSQLTTQAFTNEDLLKNIHDVILTCSFSHSVNEMVPNGGTDLVSMYGFHIFNFGRGVNLDPQFWTLYPILDNFHLVAGGGG